MKKCFKCHKEKRISEFHKHPRMADGHLGKCKECTRLDVVINRIKRLEYYQEYDRRRKNEPHRLEQRRRNSKRRNRLFPTRGNANLKARRALKRGILVKAPCEVCGDPRSEAHHDDYSKPLEVRWLCVRHHHAVHRKYDYDALLKIKNI